MKTIVGRHQEGITINPYEWLLDDKKEVRIFDSKKQAVKFLKAKGITDRQIYWLVFKHPSYIGL
jgi:hypothetical protein